MSRRQFITLRTRNSNEEVDIELPANQPISKLMPDLLKALNWPQTRGSTQLRYHLETESGDDVKSDQTFAEAGVDNFDVLWIVLDNDQQPAHDSLEQPAGAIPGLKDQTTLSEEELGGSLPPPFWTRIPIDAPCLVSASGMVFVLGKPPITIGRRSHKSTPGIDLSELDTDFISSRTHAEVLVMHDLYTLHALNTKNGMLVNGSELPAGALHPLTDGDTLQFGFRGVQLVFRQPVKA